MKTRKRAKASPRTNGHPVTQGCHLSVHHALWDKFYEKASKTLDDPELDREIARAVIPVLEKALKRLKAEAGE